MPARIRVAGGGGRAGTTTSLGRAPRSPPRPPTPGFYRRGGGCHPSSTRRRVRVPPRRPRRTGACHTLQWSRTPSRGGAAATLAPPLPLSRPLLLVAASVGVVLGRLARAACRGANGHRAAPPHGEPSCPPPPPPPLGLRGTFTSAPDWAPSIRGPPRSSRIEAWVVRSLTFPAIPHPPPSVLPAAPSLLRPFAPFARIPSC